MSVHQDPLLRIQDLCVTFPSAQGFLTAVNHFSLSLMPGQIMGLVGESGCGKSITSLAILGLVPKPGSIASGQIWFEGQDLTKLSNEALRRLRGSQIAMIPQDPLTSLNPVYTIGNQLSEVLMLHKGMSKDDALMASIAMLERVQVPNAKGRIHDYPHQFSGGMRQRVMIAMALCCEPKLLIADEPTTALDVTVQAQILTLMRELQQELGMAVLLITHDLGVVAELCQNVAVMYAGRLIEQADVTTLFQNPSHPYTQGLLASLPMPGKQRLVSIEGQPPALNEIPLGCSFEPRCEKRFEPCTAAFPGTTALTESHTVSCYLHSPLST